METAQDDAIRSEICTYLQMGVFDEELDDDPLVFWKTANFVYFKSVAKVVLTKSASSVPVECMFSTMGLILDGKRFTLAEERADELSFIHDNFHLL